MSIPRAMPLALLAAVFAIGCGGDDSKSEEDRASDVAERYVHTHSNNEEENCAKTLAAGVDAEFCNDLGPLVSRNNPETKKATVTGSTAKVTVTGAGPTRIDVNLVKEGEDWKVKSWKGYAAPPES